MTSKPTSTSRNSSDPSRRFDIRDVAKRARVSIATVSRTINGVPTVDKVLAARVWKAVEQLKYYPNTQARALVSGKSKLLGLLISEITNPFFPELIQGFEDIAVRNGYDVLISSTSNDPARMEVCIRRLLERKVEGVAVMTFGIEAPLLDRLADRAIPLVFVDMTLNSPLSSTLRVDYQTGIQQGVEHLAALGHTGIGFVSGPLRQRSAALRKESFRSALAEIGLEEDANCLLEGDHTLEGGMAAMEKLLALKKRPTAVMCSNDMTAIGALRVLAKHGIRVPEDFSIIGFDNIHLAEFVYPALTTIQMSRKDLAHGAFEALKSAVKSTSEATRQREFPIPTVLIVRGSTGPVAQPGTNKSAATSRKK